MFSFLSWNGPVNVIRMTELYPWLSGLHIENYKVMWINKEMKHHNEERGLIETRLLHNKM